MKKKKKELDPMKKSIWNLNVRESQLNYILNVPEDTN